MIPDSLAWGWDLELSRLELPTINHSLIHGSGHSDCVTSKRA